MINLCLLFKMILILLLLECQLQLTGQLMLKKQSILYLDMEKYLSDYKFQIEGYYKNIYNMLTFIDQRASTDGEVSSEQLSDILTPSDGEGGGLEFFIQKLKGDFTGWLNYTLSYSIKEMNGKTYFTNWDRRHIVLNVIGNKKIKGYFFKNWDFNWKFTYQSGQSPYSDIRLLSRRYARFTRNNLAINTWW